MIKTYYPGNQVSVYNTQKNKYMSAIIMQWYGYKSKEFGNYPSLIDVYFPETNTLSNGHFTWGVKELS